MIVAMLVSAFGFLMWLAAFLMGASPELEAYFFGFHFGGLACASTIFFQRSLFK
jgi:hypothetical protein